MTWNDVVIIALKLPSMKVSFSCEAPALRANGKLVTRYREEEDSIVLLSVPLDERRNLLTVDPNVFYIKHYYRENPAVLAWLTTLEPERLWPLLVRRWLEVAPGQAIAQFYAVRSSL